MDQARVAAIRQVLRAARLEALVLRLPENIVMALGVWPMNGCSYALVTAEAGPVALIAPSCEDEEMGGCWAQEVRFYPWPRLDMPDPVASVRRLLRELAAKHHLDRARLGYEGGFESVAAPHNAAEPLVPSDTHLAFLKTALPKATWRDATSALHHLRARKTEAEIAKLRVANRVAAFGLKKFISAVAPGVSEAELAGMVYQECLVRGVALPGVRLVNVFPQISSGSNAHRAWRPIVTTGKRRLKPGELAVLELAVCVDGFWADTTRVRVAGEPSPIQRRAFAAVKQAQAAALHCIRPGIPAAQVHETATRVLVAAGFEMQVVHLTGHGLGFRYHEPEPFLMPGNLQPLEPGHVCSVEPGLYDPAWGGIRIEDNVAVTAQGVEVLTHAPKVLG